MTNDIYNRVRLDECNIKDFNLNDNLLPKDDFNWLVGWLVDELVCAY